VEAQAATQPLERVRVLHAFASRDFRLLWSGQLVSLVGDAAFLTALGWRTFTLAGSTRFGIVLVCQSAALLTTVLVGGALADRYPRRAMMIASDLARLCAVGTLAGIDASGHLSFTWIVVLATSMGLGDGLFFPAFGGIVPTVVEPAHVPSANSLIGVARWGSLLVGPSVAAFLYDATSPATVFAADAGSFLVSAGLLALTRPRAVEPDAREGTLREIGAGVRYVASVPWLWVTIALFGVVLMLQLAPQQVLLPKLVARHFHRGVAAYGLLTSLLGLGTVLGTLLFGQLQPRAGRGVLSYVIWVVNSLCLAALVLSPWYPLAGALAVVRGACIGFGVAVWETMLMELVPERLLSRVISLDYFGSFGLMPVGLAFTAGIAGLASPGTIIAGGALVSAGLFAAGLTRPWLREVD
jgi:DHA3 family tetracycline resistance protein-like MFS transporter